MALRVPRRLAFLAIAFLLAAGLVRAAEVDIPYQKFMLKNGLTVLVHEDHKAPVAAISVWYHVGSKNERPGKTGFAHLFEHMMFNGSEHNQKQIINAMTDLGASFTNGSTYFDRTNYVETIPTSSLDAALWIESDRMGHLLGSVTQKLLDTQRGVVQNEKRQGENQPYAIAREIVQKHCFPAGHPYSWTVIGEMADLSSATLSDVHAWFKKYYGPSNAVLVIAGDIKPAEAKAKAEKYFGDIPPGPPLERPTVWIAKRNGVTRHIAQDRVPQARIEKVWNVPQDGTRESAMLDLAASVLSDGKNSRFYKRLVYDDQIATNAGAGNTALEIAGLFTISATAKPEAKLAQVEKELDEELARFLKDGPTEKELQRVRAQMLTGFIGGLEQVGGFGGKAEILAQGQTYEGNPAFYKTYLKWIREAKPADVQAAAKKWLADGAFILEIHPVPDYQEAKSGADRTKAPEMTTPPDAKFPALQRATLGNGLKVVLAECPTIPMVKLNLILKTGGSADPREEAGTAGFALSLLNEGTTTRSALEISEALDSLGAGFSAGAGNDTSSIDLSVLKENLDPALELYADLLLHPAYPEKELERVKKLSLAGIRRAKASPPSAAGRVQSTLLFGKEHPYARMQTEAGVQKIAREKLVRFHETWVKPNNAVLVVVGAITLPEITGRLEKLFQDWKPGELPQNKITPAPLGGPGIYLIDKPGAEQSYVVACHLAPARNNADEIAASIMNRILGGEFASRINTNLRETKHWTYGARSAIAADGRWQRSFRVTAPVQTDKTQETMLEIRRELDEIVKAHPVTDEEVAKLKDSTLLRLTGRWETMDAVAGSIYEILTYDLADDYFQTYPKAVRELKRADVDRMAKTVVQPDKITWIVVGDRAKIEAPLRKLSEKGFGEVHTIDADALPVK